jgi:hypothetical protein
MKKYLFHNYSCTRRWPGILLGKCNLNNNCTFRRNRKIGSRESVCSVILVVDGIEEVCYPKPCKCTIRRRWLLAHYRYICDRHRCIPIYVELMKFSHRNQNGKLQTTALQVPKTRRENKKTFEQKSITMLAL